MHSHVIRTTNIDCTPIWSLWILRVHSDVVHTNFESALSFGPHANAFQSGPPLYNRGQVKNPDVFGAFYSGWRQRFQGSLIDSR